MLRNQGDTCPGHIKIANELGSPIVIHQTRMLLLDPARFVGDYYITLYFEWDAIEVIFLFYFLVAQMVKHLPTMRETQLQSLGQEGLLEKEMATHSSILAWE